MMRSSNDLDLQQKKGIKRARYVAPRSPAGNTQVPTTPVSAAREGTLSIADSLEIAHEIVGLWKKLGRTLGLSNSKLIQIDKDQADDVYEKSYQMLIAWQEKEAENATYSALAKALSSALISRNDLVERFCIL